MGNNYSKPLAGQARGLLVDFDDLARFGVDNHAMLVHHRKRYFWNFGTSMIPRCWKRESPGT
jgi:hypothetical protein